MIQYATLGPSSRLVTFPVKEVWILSHCPALAMHRQEQKNSPANSDRWGNEVHKALNGTMARGCQLFLMTCIWNKSHSIQCKTGTQSQWPEEVRLLLNIYPHVHTCTQSHMHSYPSMHVHTLAHTCLGLHTSTHTQLLTSLFHSLVKPRTP